MARLQTENAVSSSLPWQLAFGTPRQSRYPLVAGRFLLWHKRIFLPSLQADNTRQTDGEKKAKKHLTATMTPVK
jgi:hypothetical protein